MRLRQLIITLYSFAPASSLDVLPNSSRRDIFLNDPGDCIALNCSRSPPLVPIDSNKLQSVLNVSPKALHTHAEELERFSRLDPDGNRAFGGLGHNLTVEYIHKWFLEEGVTGYYEVKKHTFDYPYSYGISHLVVQGQTLDSSYFTYAPPTDGALIAPLVLVENLGCHLNDYNGVAGKIALIKRGECPFAMKSTLAGNASAKAILVFNNEAGGVTSGTYGSPVPSTGRYVPGAMISQIDGLAFVENLKKGIVTVNLTIDAKVENRTSTNLIVDTNCGDHKNTIVLGAHSDSVGAGPGINDNGSGVIALMEVAKALAQFRIQNAVRFCFWTAEEFGLVGSTKYLEGLSAADRDNIALYLNFDMIASPNYVYFVYDGDGSASNITSNITSNFTGPAGSGEIEKLFTDYFTLQHKKVKPTPLDGRSDYAPFIDAGIPLGGLFTGASGNKTQAEADEYGGTAGEPYDSNYHRAGDNATNLNYDAWGVNMKAIAHAVAIYANSTTNIPKRKPQTGKFKRNIWQQQSESTFHYSPCGHKLHLV